MTRMYWFARGIGTPRDKDEVNECETSECDGRVCDLDMMGEPSIFLDFSIYKKQVTVS